jgi:hypothetical protein
VGQVTVSPETFNLVHFDAGELTTLCERLLDDLGMGDVDLRVEVDEQSPLGRAVITDGDPVVISAESGALEDPKRPRQLSDTGSADVLGRLLLRVRDRRDPEFGDPPADDDLTLPQSAAWDAYCIGRLVRLGHRHYNNRQRRLYHFRNRHGFTDAADEAFDRLWTADHLTWADIDGMSEAALAAREAAPA